MCDFLDREKHRNEFEKKSELVSKLNTYYDQKWKIKILKKFSNNLDPNFRLSLGFNKNGCTLYLRIS